MCDQVSDAGYVIKNRVSVITSHDLFNVLYEDVVHILLVQHPERHAGHLPIGALNGQDLLHPVVIRHIAAIVLDGEGFKMSTPRDKEIGGHPLFGVERMPEAEFLADSDRCVEVKRKLLPDVRNRVVPAEKIVVFLLSLRQELNSSSVNPIHNVARGSERIQLTHLDVRLVVRSETSAPSLFDFGGFRYDLHTVSSFLCGSLYRP